MSLKSACLPQDVSYRTPKNFEDENLLNAITNKTVNGISICDCD